MKVKIAQSEKWQYDYEQKEHVGKMDISIYSFCRKTIAFPQKVFI